MYHKKKIALFVSHIYGDYQKNLCQGIIDQSCEYGYQTEIYATSDGENLGDYGIGEESILKIPNFDDFSGIIIATETYRQHELRDHIITVLKKRCDCPVVEIAESNQHFPSISLENNLSAGTLTEHLITVHNDKRICYLGCAVETFFSDQRQQAYEATMARHSLTVGPNDIYLSDYSEDSYLEAIRRFTMDHTTKPDAVVCYNDRIALHLMIDLLHAGYNIPKDIALVGCDCIPEGQNIDPPLTSVTFPSYSVGTQAATQLIHLIHKEEIPNITTVFAEPHIAGSCGCSYDNNIHPIFFGQELVQRIGDVEASIITSMRMSTSFSHITDIDEGMDLLEKYITEIENCSEFYLCLYSDWDSLSGRLPELADDDYEEDEVNKDTILLKLALRAGKRLPECSFSKTSLLPEYIYKDSNSSYIVSPLFFEDRAFGYIALAYEDNQVNYHFQLVHWIMNITQLLQNICEFKCTQILSSKLEAVYMKDVLTGLYNHHGFHHYKSKMLANADIDDRFTAFLFDLDELKTINDRFGHSEGDFALKVIGQALESTAQPDDICARFSGDEFYVLTKNYSEEDCKSYIAHVEKYLNNYNRLSEKPYNISISCGYKAMSYSPSFNEDDIAQLFQDADSNMYDVKKHKIKHVLRDSSVE